MTPVKISKQFTLLNSFHCAGRGMMHAVQQERNLKIHVGIFMGMVALGLTFGLTRIEWAMVLGVSGLVFVTELLNTSIEGLVDWLANHQQDPRARFIKDVAAGACLIAALTAVAVGGLVFVPKLWPQ